MQIHKTEIKDLTVEHRLGLSGIQHKLYKI